LAVEAIAASVHPSQIMNIVNADLNATMSVDVSAMPHPPSRFSLLLRALWWTLLVLAMMLGRRAV